MAPAVSLIRLEAESGSANVWRKGGGRKWAETRAEEVRPQDQYLGLGRPARLALMRLPGLCDFRTAGHNLGEVGAQS
jgi:hypothetical protein